MNTTSVFEYPPPGAIDAHAHVFGQGLPMAAKRRYTPDYSAGLERYLSLLQGHGLAGGVLIQPSFLGYDNRYLLDSLGQARGQCKGVVALDPATPPVVLREMAAAGVVGVRLNLFGQLLPAFQDPVWHSFLSCVNRLDWHVEVHCPNSQLPDVLAPLLARGCKLVVDHFGRPDYRLDVDPAALDYLCRTADTGRVWVKLSAPYRIWSEQTISQSGLAARRLLDAFSARRLLWGSDWPHTQHEAPSEFDRALQHLFDWVPNAQDRSAILADTPRLLFKY
ncbi:amidohydrolase family protein [Paralcaligenes ginsengisoli]